ncbi:hypothetical protein A9Q02_14035 [Candidatus Chloroploca asiatica]|uniref:Uncharacterized protein n=1 Tax=Candidatus Chloroploca asiatica TaxID=1506545 RepID=A0A2H3KLT6_9CHLR|nr:hypothetical protein A9Q02_14035 [Candidatus Chloroploca asiatica]
MVDASAMKARNHVLLLLAFTILFLYPQKINADMGAKSTMSFSFQYRPDVRDITLEKGQLLECEDSVYPLQNRWIKPATRWARSSGVGACC